MLREEYCEKNAVIRRKLFAYTTMFAAGISAGFFILERGRLAGGVLIMLVIALSACAAAGMLPCEGGLHRGRTGCLLGHCLRYMGHTCNKVKTGCMGHQTPVIGRGMCYRLIASMMAGFILFTCRYVWYGTGIESVLKQYMEDINTIEGRVRSVAVSDGKLKITLDNTDAVKKGIRVLVTLKPAEGGDYYISYDDDCHPAADGEPAYGDFRNEDSADPSSRAALVLIGQHVRAYGRLREPQTADNPGCFDYRIYLRSRGIGYTFSAGSITIAGTAHSRHAGLPDISSCLSRSGMYQIDRHFARYMKALYITRENFLSEIEDEEIRGFVRGVIFGDKSDISDDVMEDFNNNGTGHILAVSGLHIGFLYSLIRMLTGRSRSIRSAVLTVAVLIMYGDMTMWSPATVRAVTVLAVSTASIYVRRPFDLLSAVSTAALILLIREPYNLLSSGFQMSFLALLGIAFLSAPIAGFTGEAFAVMLSVQAGIMPVTALVFHRINVLSIFINIPVIFLASVLVPVCMTALFLSIVTGAAGATAAVTGAAEGLSEIILRLNEIVSYGGTLSNQVTAPDAGTIVFVYLTMFLLSSEWLRVLVLRSIAADSTRRTSSGLRLNTRSITAHDGSNISHVRIIPSAIVFVMICVISVSCSFGIASYNEFADDEIVFVSVGQGDCTHIRAGKGLRIGSNNTRRMEPASIGGGFHLRTSAAATGAGLTTETKDVFIDGGGSTERNVGEDVLMPYLLANGAERVELGLVTHLHTDHYRGIAELADVFPVGAVGIPSDYRKSAEEQVKTSAEHADASDKRNTLSSAGSAGEEESVVLPENIEFIEPGSRINVAKDVYIEPLWPVEAGGKVEIDDPNEHNMVYMVNYRGVKIMVTGDLLEEDELKMVEYYKGTDALRCDVLKVAHHGSKSSSCEEFLDACDPQIAVIQVGLNNFYGHPHRQTLERLEERGIKVYRNDLNGAVGIDIRKGGIKVDTMRD